MLHISDHADDLPEVRSVGVAEIQTLANRVLIRPEPARHGFVEDHNLRRLQTVSARETTALTDRNLHRLEIARADAVNVRHEKIARRQRRPALDAELRRSPLAGKREVFRA